MKVQIYGKNVTITQGMQEKVENKLKFLDKYFIIEDYLTANVVAKVHTNDVKVEITIPTKFAVLRAEVVHEDFYAAIDLAIDKLEDQIRRQKTRLERKLRNLPIQTMKLRQTPLQLSCPWKSPRFTLPPVWRKKKKRLLKL